MENSLIYMDHSATTPMREEVLEVMLPFFRERYGNPSSLHAPGRAVRAAVEEAREKTALALGADPGEIFFTSGGTESNNIALRGVAKRRGTKGHIITSSIEHHAILDVCRDMEKQGYSVTFLPVDNQGRVNPADVEKAITADTFIISIMFANNEIGTIQPIAEIGVIAKSRGVLFHCDAVQAIGQLPVDVRELNLDLLSLSAHKFNGPKGVGALYKKKKTPLSPLYNGGGQEGKLRPGTENVPAIVGLGRAIELAASELPSKADRLTKLRERLIEGLLVIDDVLINGHRELRLPNNVNASFKYIEGESILLGLDLQGVAVSSGSACSSGSLDPSHVLSAIGLDHATSHGSIRFSLGLGNSESEVDQVIEIIKPVVERLRKMSPTYHS